MRVQRQRHGKLRWKKSGDLSVNLTFLELHTNKARENERDTACRYLSIEDLHMRIWIMLVESPGGIETSCRNIGIAHIQQNAWHVRMCVKGQ